MVHCLPINPMENPDSPTPQKAELHKSIILALAETKDIVANDYNPFHKSKFANLSTHLSTLKPIFAKYNLAIVQFPTTNTFQDSGSIGVKTLIIHANGESLESSICIPVDSETSGQQAGALITYLRRYALACVAGVATDDDDAEADRTIKTAKTATKATYVTGVAPVAKASYQPVTAPQVTEGVQDSIDPSIPVPFGNNKGTAIGELGLNDLAYWATKWEPRPYEKTGKVTAKDAKLKATAVALYQNAQGGSQENSEDVPF